MLTIIAAMTNNNVIGLDNTLPWKQKNDMQRFKALTLGTTVVMGRKTFESMGSKELPHRKNIIISRTLEGDNVVEDLELFLTISGCAKSSSSSNRVMIIGGAEIYNKAIYHADMLYITKLNCEIEGDAFFPEIDPARWRLVAQEHYKADENNQYDYSFLTYIKDTRVL